MLSKPNQDHLFLLQVDGKESLSVIFCNKRNEKEEARKKVKKVLANKNINKYVLNYLGELNYSNMDKEVIDQLDFFEKHDDVWIVL